MQRGEGESVSIWHEALAEGGLHPLRENVSVEVCVVGAGISGLSTAYMLAKEGKSVVVVDAWGIGAGETGRTTAHLSAVLDDRFFKLERIYGQKGATLAAESHMSAIHRIEQIATEENIKCDFERLDGYLAAPTSSQRKDFYQEAEATLRAGFADRQVLERMPVEGVEIGPVMRFPQQATFHLGKYLQGLARAFQALGGSIYTGTHVKEVQGGAKPFAITDDGYRIRAGAIVVATNTPVNDRVKMHTKQAAYRSYVVAYEVPRRTYAPFLLWDMQEPYHYVRIVHGRKCDMLLVGGEDHKTGQANDAGERYQRLDEWAQTYFTTLGPIRYRWSGQVMEPVDSLAFIGLNPGEENVYIATGDSGHGITHGTIAGMLLTDLIQGRRNPWQELYDPARKPLHSLASYIEENANAVGCMTKDWLGPGEVSSARELAPGNGAVIRSGLSKLAVYKDEQGRVHQCSAVCPHLGCIVQWNAGEKSWDCPCHGSRFDVEGRILNGPALRRLDQAEAAEKPAKEVRWKKVK